MGPLSEHVRQYAQGIAKQGSSPGPGCSESIGVPPVLDRSLTCLISVSRSTDTA